MPVYPSCNFALGLDKNKDEQPTQIRESRSSLFYIIA
jgi:hypothetical protein